MNKNFRRYQLGLSEDFKKNGRNLKNIISAISLPINIYANFAIIGVSWEGWLAKFILDIFFFNIYWSDFDKTPNLKRFTVLLHMFIFIPIHFWGFLSWVK